MQSLAVASSSCTRAPTPGRSWRYPRTCLGLFAQTSPRVDKSDRTVPDLDFQRPCSRLCKDRRTYVTETSGPHQPLVSSVSKSRCRIKRSCSVGFGDAEDISSSLLDRILVSKHSSITVGVAFVENSKPLFATIVGLESLHSLYPDSLNHMPPLLPAWHFGSCPTARLD